jgi:hypothetical protein
MSDLDPPPFTDVGFDPEKVRGYDWRTVGEDHPQQHQGAHYRGVWPEHCKACRDEREALE